MRHAQAQSAVSPCPAKRGEYRRRETSTAHRFKSVPTVKKSHPAGINLQRLLSRRQFGSEYSLFFRHFQREQPRLIVLKRIHFEAAETLKRSERLQTFAMTARCDFEASVFEAGVIEKDHRGRDPRRGLRQIGPIREILMENDVAALARAL